MNVLVKLSSHQLKYLKNTLWLLLDLFLRQGLNIIVGIYVARYLKPEGLGEVAYAGTYTQLFMPLAHIGLTSIVVRDLVKNKEEEDKILGTAFYFKLLASALSFFSIVVIILLSNQNTDVKWNIFIASSSILLSPFLVIDLFFQSAVKVKYVVVAQQASALIGSLLRILGVLFSFSTKWFIGILLAEAIILSIGLVFMYMKHKHKWPKWHYDKVIAKRFVRELGPVILSGFFVAIYMRIDQVMIYNLLSSDDLGIYSAAVKLCEPFYMVATLMCGSLFPAIVTGLEIGREEYTKRLQQLLNLLTWLAIFASLIVQIGAPLIVTIIYGDAYQGCEGVLRIYFWASIMVFQGVAISQAMVTEKLQHLGTIFTLIGALINIMLNYAFIPAYGVNGAAFATLIAYTFSAIIMNAIFKQTRPFFVQQLTAFTIIFTKPKLLLKSVFNASKNSP